MPGSRSDGNLSTMSRKQKKTDTPEDAAEETETANGSERAAEAAAHEAEAASGEPPPTAETDNPGGEAPDGDDAGSELDKARREASEMKTRYLRSVADMENFRKRVAREKQDTIRSAAAGVVEKLLPVLDNMKLGLRAAENHPEAKDVTEGFRMVDTQLRKVLGEEGLEEIRPDGEKFDPNTQECLSHQPSQEVPENHVIETVRSGYRLNDRLLRPANVVVSSGSEGDANSADS